MKKIRKTIETYLFFPELTKLSQKHDLDFYLNYLQDCIVFLSKKAALQQGRFIQKNYTVLKAFVPHTAIIGQSNGLSLKKDSITKANIHGYFPNLAKSNLYIENPSFDQKYSPKFLHTHEELFANTEARKDFA